MTSGVILSEVEGLGPAKVVVFLNTTLCFEMRFSFLDKSDRAHTNTRVIMRIIIAGGGTGGHLFPGIALAEEFEAQGAAERILFVGTTRGLEQRIVPALGYDLRTITSAGLLGKNAVKKLLSLISLMAGFVQALGIVVRFRPRLVVGTGGYVSAPVLAAAWLFGVRTAICEQNSIPGMANRMLGRLVKHVFIAFEESRQYFPAKKTVCTGNPVRRAFLSKAEGAPGKDENRGFCILILGGSQGAHSVNRSMVDALDDLKPLRNRLHCTHQTGAADHAWVERAYKEKGFSADVSPFIDDMTSAYNRADLVVSRAGAITVTELLICGKPAILVPYPHAAHNHQEMNARMISEKGAARMILDKDLSGTRLAEMISTLHDNEKLLREMKAQAYALARPKAARNIVDRLTSESGMTAGGYRIV